ncbi:MAG: LamG domain-containing protein, partial [Planctomycetota bacterium]
MFRRALFELLLAVMVGYSATANVAVANLERGLVGWWKMDNIQDGKVIDASGTGNDGELVGICEQTEGFVGSGGLKITNGGVQIPNSPLLDASRFTIAMWVNWADGQGALARLLQMGDDNKESIAILGGGGASDGGPSSNIFYFTMFGSSTGEGSDSSEVKAPGVFKGGKWHHIAAIYDGSDQLVYVDGKEVGSSSLVLGCRPPNMDRTFNGVLDDVRMYSKALTAQDVRKLYVFKGGAADKAALPNPADKGENVLPNQKLKWMKGSNAESSVVYFGTDESAVKSAKVGDAEYNGSTAKESFDPGGLEFDKDYFWRVDSVAKGAASAQPAATEGLVGWWKCDEGTGEMVADSSGHGHHGKVFGATSWQAGHIGKGALKITNFQEGENITNGGVVIADSPLLRPSRFTVAMWVKWSRDFRQKALNRILQKGNDNKETFVIIGGGGADNRGNADNRLSFAIAQETRGDVYNVTADGNFEGGKWYHVAASYDGSDMLLYVDGKPAGKNTIDLVKVIAIEGEPLVIGSRPPNMDRGFDGAVDDVRMYNKALSPEDVRTLYESKAGGVSKGDVWSFSTLAGKAENPTPDPLLKKVDTNTKLTWEASPLAKSHDVYFGDDLDEVANATKGSKTHKGTLALGKEFFDPGKLEEGKYYYWCVDENCAAGIAKGDVWQFRTKGGSLVIQVDLAVKTCDRSQLYPGLAKPGWTIWASDAWTDMYMHDYQIFPLKADGSGLDEGGINGTGVTLWFTTGNEGQLGIGAKGICRDNLGGDGCPTGTAEGDPIANSWAYGVDWVGPYAGDLLLLIRNLPAGTYQINSYHNFWEPCTQSTRNCLNCDCGMPPMPAITARSLPEQLVSLDANGVRTEGGWTWKANLPKGTGKGVEPILNAYNVAPQH